MLTLNRLLHELDTPLESLGEITNPSKVVRSVGLVESAETAEWLSGGSLLLTQAETLDQMTSIDGFIEKLAFWHCSGLAIRGARDEQIIKRALAQAEEHGLALFRIPNEVTLLDVMNPISRELIRDNRASYCAQCTMKRLLHSADASRDDVQLLGLERPERLGLVVFRTEFNIEALAHEDEGVRAVALIDRFEDTVADSCSQMKVQGRIVEDVILKELDEISVVLLVEPSVDYNHLISSFEEQVETGDLFRFGVSEVRPFNAAGEAYGQAEFAFRNGNLLTGTCPICRYRDVEFYQHINRLSEFPETEAFFAHTDMLADHPHLLKTLITFFEMNEQFKPTSERLFIHVNTLRYRLEQIKKITGLDYNLTSEKVWLFLGAIHLNEQRARG